MDGGESGFLLTRTDAGPSGLLRAGDRLADRYEVERLLGGGGMGLVYAARDDQLGERVALKVLRGATVTDEAATRFREEIRLARRVSHPGVVRIHDIGRDGALTFLTMDLVPGETLRERLASGPLAQDDAVAIARQLAEALQAAHDEGIVHRDVKPSNVLVAWSEDRPPRAWLTDFGIARAVDGAALTAADATPGTPAYLSPEQVRGEPVTPATDIYALGLVFCEMLTGRVPVSGETVAETLGRRGSGRVPLLRAMTDQPEEIRAVVARCVCPDPRDRFESASALAQALRGLSAGGRAQRRRLPALALAGGAVLALSAAPFLARDDDADRVVRAEGATRGPVGSGAPETTPAAAPSVAVLPLSNATGDPAYDWVRSGLADSIAQRLAEAGVPVIGPARVRETLTALRIEPDDVPAGGERQLATLLDAERLLTGRLLGGEGGRRLEAVLTERGTTTPISVPVRGDDVLGAADALILAVLRQAAAEGAPAPVRLTSEPAALVAYDEGSALSAKGEPGAAADAFAAAVAADPSFALGWDALAASLTDDGREGEAILAAERAVALAGEEGYASLRARARLASLSGEPGDAARLLTELVAAYPNDQDARVALAEAQGSVGAFDAAHDQLETVVEAAPNHPRAWYLLGKFAILNGDARRAVDDYLLRALTVQNRLNSPAGQSEVFNAMGIAHERLGELDAARQYYVNASETARTGGDQGALATALTNAGRLALYTGDKAAARETLLQARDTFRALGDEPGVADVEVELGLVAEEAGEFDEALEHYREAARMHAAYGDDQALISDRTNMAFAYAMTGRYDDAQVHAASALAAAATSGNTPATMRAQQVAGEIALARGEWEAALSAYLAALRLARASDDPYGEAVAEGGLGRVAFEQGRFAAALQAWRRADDLLTPLGDERGRLEYALLRAELLAVVQGEEAVRAALEGARAFEEAGSAQQRSRLRRLEARLAPSDAAAALFAEAVAFADEAGDPAGRLAARIDALRRLDPANAGAAADLLAEAKQLGHALLVLEASRTASEAALAAGTPKAAAAIASAALRPPLARSPWRGEAALHDVVAEAGPEGQRARHADAAARLRAARRTAFAEADEQALARSP